MRGESTRQSLQWKTVTVTVRANDRIKQLIRKRLSHLLKILLAVKGGGRIQLTLAVQAHALPAGGNSCAPSSLLPA